MKWQAYPKYKDFDVEWLGKIPEEWEINRIKHTTYVKGRIGWKGLKSDEFIDEGPYLLTGTDFDKGRINWHRSYHVSEERYKEDPYIQLKENDLLITKDGTIGKVAIVKNLPGKACLNSGIFVTRPTKKEYITSYMYWLLNSEVFSRFIDYTKTGTTISHLYQNVFVEFAFPRPSITEQHTIAAFLDCETSRIDNLISKKERQIELLQEKRAALISHAVTKGLDPNAKMKDSHVEWLGKIPEHWNVKRLKYLSSVNDETLEENTNPDYEILYVDISNVDAVLGIKRKVNMAFKNAPSRARRKVKHGDIIVSTVRTYLKAITPIDNPESNLIVSTGFAVIRPICEFDSKFASFVLRASYFVDTVVANSVGVSYPAINASELITLYIALPPIPEQHDISKFLDHETGRIDALIEKIRKSIDMLHEYRTALISAAVTGKIDVRVEVVE